MKAALATILILICSIAAMAQSTSVDKTYRIRPEDVLRIQVYGEQQVNVEVPVGEDGNISAPFVGTVKAEGKTSGELESELTDLYRTKLRLRDPKVSVGFQSYRPWRALISGAVGHPSVYTIRPGDTVLTLLALGGDATEGLADMHRARLRRAGWKEEIPIDLYALERRGDISQNYELEDGDELIVPADSQNNVKVYGYVQRPGTFPYREPMMLADAISQAGGEIPTKSRMSRVAILREDPASPGQFKMIRCDFVKFVHGDVSQNVQLEPNDFIYVPATNTPDINAIAAVINSVFYVQGVLRNGIFGLRLFH